MDRQFFEPRLSEELRTAITRGLASGELLTAAQISQQAELFLDHFGPAVLRGLDGGPLLQLMHGREDTESRCLMYWLEFKNDDEFAGYKFGGIGGGSALKFGIFQRQSDHAWVAGSPNAQRVISPEEAVAVARRQRDELLAGNNVLATMDASDTSDDAYGRLQVLMEEAAPELSSVSWAHKYWFLAHHDRLDDYHNPRYQRFHLFKLLQTPPDNLGILDGKAPRFNCAVSFRQSCVTRSSGE